MLHTNCNWPELAVDYIDRIIGHWTADGYRGTDSIQIDLHCRGIGGTFPGAVK